MMKKRIKISILTLLFLVSTTGLPVSYHLCQMMQEKSLSECDVCKAEIEKIESFCCSQETEEFSLTISSGNPACCQDGLVYYKVEDEFLFNKSESKVIITVEYSIFTSVSPADFSHNPLTRKYLTSSSPPTFLTNEIYLNNSVFLI